MTPMRLRFVTSIAASCWMLQTPAATAQGFDGEWTGTISCAKLLYTKGTLRAPMVMTVAKAQATYARNVFNADGSRIVGTEEGKGTIGADGKLTLTSTWRAAGDRPRYTYMASYEGTMSAASATLRGMQVWSFDGKTENCPCTITLKRETQ